MYDGRGRIVDSSPEELAELTEEEGRAWVRERTCSHCGLFTPSWMRQTGAEHWEEDETDPFQALFLGDPGFMPDEEDIYYLCPACLKACRTWLRGDDRGEGSGGSAH